MSNLRNYFDNNPGRLLWKWHHYFEIYERHFARFRNTEVHVMEIGVFHGGSMQMWKEYFGPRAHIYGVDIDPQVRQFEEDRVQIFIGDQANRDFLRQLKQAVPRIDVFIDDGGHTMKQQIVTFQEMFLHIDPDGVYLIEDLHTSYWKQFGGGFRKPGTFIEFSKLLIDQLHAWHSEGPETFRVDRFTRSAHSMHYYDSVLVVEKRRMQKPVDSQTGKAQFPLQPWKKGEPASKDGPH